MKSKFLPLPFCVALLWLHACLASDMGLTLETGGAQIVLGTNWDRLDQPENFFVQKRALNTNEHLALGAGAFKLDLTLEEYLALGVLGMELGPEKTMKDAIELTAKLAHVRVGQAKKAVESQIGQETLDQLKKASALCAFEVLEVTKIEISGATAFDIHSKVTLLKSGQTVFSREFIFEGAEPQQIVQITYSGASDDIYRDKNLLGAIKKPKR